MIDPRDMAHCAEAIRHGSRSFHAASMLLPKRLRDPAKVLYAFCRLADDAVDLRADKSRAVLSLADRLDRVYAGLPQNAPADRAFAVVVEEFDMPRALPEALLEGLAWDAEGRRYATLSDLTAYSARVASAVGAMMCVLMRVRDCDALARACDLGVAMQFTNIARDVGEDACEGRLYMPLVWLDEAGIDPKKFLSEPVMSMALAEVLRRLLREADALYVRSEAGIARLPVDCRAGIFAARQVYAGIGTSLARIGFDAVGHRARTTGGQKLGWLFLSAMRAVVATAMPVSPVIYARPLREAAFLVDAAADPTATPGRSETVFAVLAGLKARDIEHRAALMQARSGARSPA
jgi:15-cis-phytoene synthase